MNYLNTFKVDFSLMNYQKIGKVIQIIGVLLVVTCTYLFGQKTAAEPNHYDPFNLFNGELQEEVKLRSDLDFSMNLHSPDASYQILRYQSFKATLPTEIELRQGSTPTVWVPIQFHVAKNVNGFSASTPYTIDQIFAQINATYQDANVQFYKCGPINYIEDNAIYDLNRSNRSILNSYDVSGVMNFYFVNTYSNYCGEGDYPGVGERVIYATRCFGFSSASVITHLIGQFFSLYPTHGTTNTAAELVNGSNCATAGDQICDTPADPNLYTSGYSSSTCQYTGNLLDANQEPYQPDSTNFMSYASGSCRDHFTQMQKDRIYQGATIDRSNLTGCSLAAACSNAISQFPYQEGFENGLNGWEQMEQDYYDFTINSGPTPTAGTGPGSAAEGMNYVYSEATNHFNGTGLQSPCFDLSGLGSPTLSFKYHMTGTDIFRLAIQVSTDGGFWWYGNGSSVFAAQIDGDQGNLWNTYTLDLSPYSNNESLRFRFLAILNSGGDVQDIAIDDVKVFDSCFGLNLTTTNTTCHDSSDGTVSLQLPSQMVQNASVNWSTGDLSVTNLQGLEPGTYSVTVTDNAGCNLTEQFSILGPDSLYIELTGQEPSSETSNNGVIESIVYGGTPPYTFSWSDAGSSDGFRMGLSPGEYEVTITDANNCTFSTSIFLGVSVACKGIRNNWPYTNGLEGGFGLFKQNVEDNRNWKRGSGSTPTSGTGPVGAAEGTYYRFIESSGSKGNPNKRAVLTSKKCFNLSNLSNPVFEFKYHMKGADMGSLKVQINNGIGWTNSIWEKSGDQGNDWKQATIDLTPFKSSHIQIRIVGITGNGPRSDMAIDDYRIGDAQNSSSIFLPEENQKLIKAATSKLAEQGFLVYPNPATDEITITIDDTESNLIKEIQIIDGLGRPIFRFNTDQVSIPLSTESLKPGLYYVLLHSEGEVITQKLIISR